MSVWVILAIGVFVLFALLFGTVVIGAIIWAVRSRKPAGPDVPLFAQQYVPAPRASDVEREEIKDVVLADFNVKWAERRTKEMAAKFNETMAAAKVAAE